MANKLKKHVLFTWLALSAANLFSPSIVYADAKNELPDIGSSAISALSVNQELMMGDFYVRQLRAHAPLIYDPLLNVYLNQIGQKLVSHADSVVTPFNFYLVNNNDINAFAFFGGNVVMHSALLNATDNENELASVMAHEISHVTQRHLARSIEQQQKNAPLSWVGVLGSILLSMANPSAGFAAFSATLAGTQQGVISFTQANEQEADRIGLTLMQRAGFDPKGMAHFFQKLADLSRYSSKPPQMLLTHPLPESRVSDVVSRTNQMPPQPRYSSEDYLLAKVRLLALYSPTQKNNVLNTVARLQKGNQRERKAAQYGQALIEYQAKNYAGARAHLTPLLQEEASNIWFLDLITDLDLAENKPNDAIQRLEAAINNKNKHAVLLLNLANAYMKAGRTEDAQKRLYRYTYSYPQDPNGWALLAETLGRRGLSAEEWAARAEVMALEGNFTQAITLLSDASAKAPLGSLDQARYDARIDQLRQLEKRFRSFEAE